MAALPSTSSASVPLDATARANALATAAAFAPASAGASAPTSASTSLSQAPAEVGSAVALATPAPATLVRASGVHEFNRLDETDLAEARELKLLRADMEVSHDANSADFGIAYEKKGGTKAAGCGTEVFPSQRSLQDRCKQLAMARGFQLIVSGSSTRPNGGGNVKYRCKKLHGQQFFDADTPAAELQCPFYINGYGNGAAWKITRACFLHNHYKFIGWRAPAAAPSAPPLAAPVVALSTSSSGDRLDDTTSPDAPPSQLSPAPQPARMPMQRNTTLSTKSLCQMVTDEVNKFPAPGLVMARLDGKLIKRILLSRGHTINHMMASRIKRQLQLARVLAVRTSFQTLASYFKLVAAKNPGSLIQVETTELGVFRRAVFIPSAALHAFKRSRKLVALDHILPAWCDGADPAIHGSKAAKGADATTDDTVCGVYLKALCKDSNDDVVTFALALVTEETQANWEWFLTAVQTAAAVDMTEYVVIAGRTGGVAEAIASVWPQTPHRFCVRRIVEDELVLRHRVAALTPEKVQRIYDLARSESESEFNALRTELVRLSDAAVEHLDALPKKHWVKYAFLETFRKPTFNNVTCDLVSMPSDDDLFTPSATHTSWFGADPVRSSQPLATFSRYFLQLAELFRARRDALEQRSPKELVPMRLAQMERILQGSQRCESIPCANGAFMVRSLGHTRPQIYDTWRHVNLLDWECTCQEWQDRRFPCVHAIHAAELERRRIDTLYDTIQHSVEYYRESYAIDFAACPLEAAAGVLEADANLKSPVDAVLAAEESTEQRKPGPKPKAKRVM